MAGWDDEGEFEDMRQYHQDLAKALRDIERPPFGCDCEDAVIEWYRSHLAKVAPGSIEAHALLIAAQAPLAHKRGCRHDRSSFRDSAGSR